MNEKEKKAICKSLTNMSSDRAATWLLNEYKFENENWYYSLIIMRHRSWKKSDQVRLAEYYLQRIPFASASGYEAFLSFMSVSNFVKSIEKYLPTSNSDKQLLKYYLLPLLNNKVSSDKDKNIVTELERKIS